jgi:hypothetical protein
MSLFEDDGTCVTCRDEKCKCNGDDTYVANGSVNNQDCRVIACNCCGEGEAYVEAPKRTKHVA